MKKQLITPYFFSLILLCIGLTTNGQNAYSLKSSKLTIDGTSNLHDWTSETTSLEWTGSIQVEDKKIADVKSVQVKIPVTSIKSTKGKTMDNKTYEAFNYEKYPSIVYKVTSVAVNGSTLKASGILTMAGTSKSIELSVTGKLLANGDVQFTGSQKINMKDFKMEPPTAIMGTIRVGEEVTLKFDLTVTPTANL